MCIVYYELCATHYDLHYFSIITITIIIIISEHTRSDLRGRPATFAPGKPSVKLRTSLPLRQSGVYIYIYICIIYIYIYIYDDTYE